MTPLKDIFITYQAKHLALPAFNIDSFEIYQAVESAVMETKLPCLVQLSPSEDNFIQAERLFLLVKKANLQGLPIYLNMDHGKDLLRLKKLISLGFDMVHFDGSGQDFATNLSSATTFIREIKSINPNAVVEVEFNKINLVQNGVSPDSFTTPSQALDFVSQTKADLLAVSVGNLHGVNSTQPENIDIALLQSITRAIPHVFLTLHGGSGISPDLITSAINLGIVKININTDLRLQFRQSLQSSLSSINSEKIYEYLNPVVIDLQKLVTQYLYQFSTNV